MLNRVEFIGNLTKAPELRRTETDKSVTTLDVALNYYVGEEKKTEYVQVVLWEKKAEDACNYLTKGRQVYVEAKVVVRKRQFDGKNIPIPEFHADRVLYLGTASNQNDGNNEPHERVFGRQDSSQGFNSNQHPFGGQSNNPFAGQNNRGPFGQ